MIHQILDQAFPFYQNLSVEQKEQFQYRVQDFIKGRDFIGRNGHEIDVFQKVILSAIPVQLTFGFDRYMFPYFNTIVVHSSGLEQAYKKRYSRKKINMQGAMVFCWEEVLAGLETDAYNVGLYEVAHCFYFEKFLQSEEYGTFNSDLTQLIQAEDVEHQSPLALSNDYLGFATQEQFAQLSVSFFEGLSLPTHLKRIMEVVYQPKS